MNGNDDKKERSFIRERIVRKKNVKKILFAVLGVIVLAVLFGVVAGVAFNVSRDLFGRESAPTESQIIILPRGDRDEIADGDDILTPSNEETEAESPDSSENESEDPSAVPEETEPEPITLEGIFKGVEGGIVPVTLVQQEAADWFNEPQTNRVETFGAFIAENEEAVFLLTDGTAYSEGSLYHVTIGREVLVMEPQGVDPFTGLAVLKIGKEHLNKTVQILPIGASAYLTRGTRAFLIGSLYGRYVATDEGRVTFIVPQEAMTDGYQQLLYTNMTRTVGGAGILVNENGEVIGWVSDGSAGEGQHAIAFGISTMKSLLNRLSGGVKAPYLGLHCRAVGNDEVLGTERRTGLYVEEVLPDSPAYFAGIQAGDRIISMDMQAVLTNRGLQQFLETVSPGQTVEIHVGRMNNEEEEIMILFAVLAER